MYAWFTYLIGLLALHSDIRRVFVASERFQYSLLAFEFTFHHGGSDVQLIP